MTGLQRNYVQTQVYHIVRNRQPPRQPQKGHGPTNNICTHSITVLNEPQKAHILLQGPMCAIPSPRHLLGMAHLVSTDPTVAQLHTDGWGWSGSDSSHEVPSKTAAVVTVDNSPEATCSTCEVVSDTDRWLHIHLQDPVLWGP